MIKVLDKGFVDLQSVMGNDLAIVNAARISHLGESRGDVKDKKLLFYLYKNGHTSPFEMVEFKFRIKCPLFVARQWMRHRTWSFNEVSRRYTSRNIEFHSPEIWRKQDVKDKQSSSGVADNLTPELTEFNEQALRLYGKAINAGVAREQARLFLPVGTYTEFIAKVDAHNLMNFFRLRMSEHAQHEIRLYTNAIYENYFKSALPWVYEAMNEC